MKIERIVKPQKKAHLMNNQKANLKKKAQVMSHRKAYDRMLGCDLRL